MFFSPIFFVAYVLLVLFCFILFSFDLFGFTLLLCCVMLSTAQHSTHNTTSDTVVMRWIGLCRIASDCFLWCGMFGAVSWCAVSHLVISHERDIARTT